MPTIDFINKHFNVLFQSPGLASPEKAEIFMLPEVHIDGSQRKNNAQLIDQFVHESILVLVESLPSMREVDQKSDGQAFYIKSNVRVLGWDRDTVPKMMEFSEELTVEYTVVLEMQAACYRKFCELLKMQNNKSSLDLLPAKPTAETQKLWDENVELREKFIQISQQIRPKLQKAMGDLNKIYDTFQDRNQAMIETLNKTEGMVQRRFVFAGERHLVEEEGESDPRMSVQPVRDYLQGKKAVILKYKQETYSIM